MSGIHRSKIEWCDSTWNPITGCLHGCPYCYARTNINRFSPKASEWPDTKALHAADHDPRCYIAEEPTKLYDADGTYIRSTPYPKGFAPTLHTYKLGYPKLATAPRIIFVGSMCDIFGDWIPDEWIAAVFQSCIEAPQHVYAFLTKNPTRYIDLVKKGLLPKECNYWFGSTVTTESETFWWSNIHNSFVSIEPMRGPFEALESPVKKTDWVIMGAETGPRKNKVLPERDWLEAVIKNCRATDTPVFLKNNLADIWGGPLTQEWPNAILEHINRRDKNAKQTNNI